MVEQTTGCIKLINETCRVNAYALSLAAAAAADSYEKMALKNVATMELVLVIHLSHIMSIRLIIPIIRWGSFVDVLMMIIDVG